MMASTNASVDNESEISDNGRYSGPEFISAEEKRLIRKLDRRILPILCSLYLFSYLDRSTLGNSRLMGLPKDILGGDPTGSLFDWATSAFYFAYIIFQVPATVLSKYYSPHVWIAVATVGWGTCSTLTSTAFNFGGLVTTRVGLGFFEACFGPVATLYLTTFYTKHEVGLRVAYWFGFGAVAGTFGGLIAYGVQQAHTAIENWRLLFIIEGIPTVLLGVVCFFYLPSRPDSTVFLNESERKIVLERMGRGTSGDVGAGINKQHVWMAFQDWRVYMAGAIYFAANTALASISAFLPTIIQTFGSTNALAQLLTVPPYAAAAILLTSCSFASDRIQSRGVFIVGSGLLGGIGYILLLVVQNVHVKYFAVFCIVSGTYTIVGITIAWFAHNLGSESKRAAGIPLYMAIGQCGSVLGSHIFPSTDGPRYLKGFAVSCALELLAVLCAIVLTVSFRIENRNKDKLYGKPTDNAKVDTSKLADKAPAFRYIP